MVGGGETERDTGPRKRRGHRYTEMGTEVGEGTDTAIQRKRTKV
jgi:hypothetical protein